MKAYFSGLPITATNLMTGMWRLETELRYMSAADILYIIPRGFLTDWGSVPSVVDWIIPSNSTEADPAYVLHDWLYAQHRHGLSRMTRARSDEILLEALGICGIGRIKRYTIYSAVRAWGWIAWNRRT